VGASGKSRPVRSPRQTGRRARGRGCGYFQAMAWLPDLTVAPFVDAPVATFVPAPADGVAPERFFSTSNLPTYVRLATGWTTPARPRMDGIIVQREGGLVTLEPRLVRAGEPVLVGLDEHGREGVVVHTAGFLGGGSAPAGE